MVAVVVAAGSPACLDLGFMSKDSTQEVSGDQAEGETESRPEDGLEETFARIIRAALLTGLGAGIGKGPSDFTVEESKALLEPHLGALQAYTAMATEVGQQFYLLGCQRVHSTLHGQPGVDNEMLDDAVEFHSSSKDPENPDGPAIEIDL